MDDPDKKTLRHFYCRDSLWRVFERMSDDADRGVDELVNDAMRALALQKGYLSPHPAQVPSAQPKAPGAAARDARGPARGYPVGSNTPTPLVPRTPPPPPALPPLPRITGSADVASPPVFLVFQNQKVLISKDEFIIGRGAKTSDLAIRDGNISRRHAAVVRRNGSYFIKDLSSTNGIDFNGVRIDNKKIEEGDVFGICDYKFRFTFR